MGSGKLLPGWREVHLSDLGTFLKGRGITKADLVDRGIPCLRYGDIYTTYGNTAETLTSFVTDTAAASGIALRHGDIIFAASGETAGEIGKAVAWLGESPAIVESDTIILRAHGQDPTFLVHALNAGYVVRQKVSLGKGHSVVHIHTADLARIVVILPPLHEQRRIAKILRTCDQTFQHLEALRAAKQRQKRALIQKLVTGQWRMSSSPQASRYRNE